MSRGCSMAESELRFTADIPFPTERDAEIAFNSLKVDVEPRRGGVGKKLTCCKNTLHIDFSAQELRVLRVSVNSFFDHLILVTQTLEEFDQLKTSE